MTRTRLTNGRKLEILQELDNTLASGTGGLKTVAKRHGLQPNQLRKWKAKRESFVGSRRSKKGLATGRPSLLKGKEGQIVEWVTNQRELHLPVSYKTICLYASSLDADFAARPYHQKYHAIRRLSIRYRFSIRVKTNQAQQRPDEVTEIATNWMEYIRPVVQNPVVDRKYIINMDQTPIPFNLAPNRTLAEKNSRTVGVRRTGNATVRCTAALAVAANGTKLNSLGNRRGWEIEAF